MEETRSTSPFSAQLEAMLKNQIAARGVKDERVLDAMRMVPRHVFVPEQLRYKAYDDMALEIGLGQTISQPYMVALMTGLLELSGKERVLEIGTGSGYQTAILARLAAQVYTIERLPQLSEKARAVLESFGIKNVHYMTGDGTLGWPREAPFDRVLAAAGAPDAPPPLVEQLAEGGVMVIPVGTRSAQRLLKGRKSGGRLISEFHIYCTFVPLLGEFGWKDINSL
ncbi:MAG: protein-L-isoaspartate(D-aspartate) O-methyltransferase [Actinomycetota bacterium]|nr:protein-L-isoaspartate(D-aspartate) O-methyltransferase [Actinomycetota bacterium]